MKSRSQGSDRGSNKELHTGSKEKLNKRKQPFRLSLRAVIILTFIIGVVISGLLLQSMYSVTGQYARVEQATLDYVEVQGNASLMQGAVSDLNEYARNFVITGNQEEVIKYFNEVQVQRSWDTAMAQIREKLSDETILKHLDTAETLSEQMMATQYYAMRLAIAGYEYSVAKFPQDLREQELSEEDLALTSQEQLNKASDMLFAKEYTQMKGQVDIRLDLCKDELLTTMERQHQESSEDLRVLLGRQRILIFALILDLALVLIFVLVLVIYPISRLIASIQQEAHAPTRGSSELRFLADTYNRIYDKMEDANSKLSYEASHDALTGLFNRAYYEELREQEHARNVALLIVDLDYFKSINDTWGHETGDKVLIRVARVLGESFREADRVCRIGGDEFAVVMMDVDSRAKELIRRKFASVSEELGRPDGDVPAVTISVGGAFSDQVCEEETLFRNADRALYQVKERGRNGCGFYPADEPEE